jgi:hypothetical protein
MSRTFRHWTPRYIVDRISVVYQERVAPRNPWLTKAACELLADWLSADDIGLEWGSGRSTLWFAERVAHLTSVEHDATWHNRVRSQLSQQGFANVDLRHYSLENQRQDEVSPYVCVGSEFPRGSLDFVLVDGQRRSQCVSIALEILKPGGLLILDNAEKYIPHPSRSPGSIAKQAVDVADDWRPIINCLRDWRPIWTSNGVWDTAIYCKPAAQSSAA